MDQTKLYYNGKEYCFSLNPQQIIDLLNPSVLHALLTEQDVASLSASLPFKIGSKAEFIKLITSKTKFLAPTEVFSQMLKIKYFDKDNQDKLQGYFNVCLQSYIEERKNTLLKAKRVFPSFIKRVVNTGDISENELSDNSSLFSTNSEIASAGYSSVISDEISNFSVESQNNQDPLETGNIRLSALKGGKNQLTIPPRTEEEIKEFQAQEEKRYEKPYLPFIYTNSKTGLQAVVGPVTKKSMLPIMLKPRESPMLKGGRPAFIYNSCLVRDAIARLPEGIGSKADICDLVRDSNYVNQGICSEKLSANVGGALDRLHYGEDPCVRYDQNKKVWVYLHKDRALDCPEWKAFAD